MTALAMIIGMMPMALGMGEGGEQNAPLGRAVIGGLLFATVATLFFVPVFFSLLHSQTAGESMTKRLAGFLILLLAIAIAAGIVIAGIAPRLRARQTLREDTDRLAMFPVNIIHPSRAARAEEVVLFPGIFMRLPMRPFMPGQMDI